MEYGNRERLGLDWNEDRRDKVSQGNSQPACLR